MKKFLNKILAVCLIIIVVYILIIFNSPKTADSLWKTLWLEKFNKFVLDFKKKLDKNPVEIPTTEDLTNTYENFKSWATDIWNKIVDWVNKTKETIDTIRKTANDTQEDFNKMKKNYEKIKWTIEETTENIDKVSDAINSVKNTFTGSGKTEKTNTWIVNN